MNSNDVALAFVSFGKDKKKGKVRPTLIIEETEERIKFYSLTSKYESKSKRIQRQYFAIKDWQEAGLDMPSWVDIRSVADVKKVGLSFEKIGTLTYRDSVDLVRFIDKYYRRR